MVDHSSPQRDEQISEVNKVLKEIGADHVPCILVYNKIDMAGLEPSVERDEHGTISRVFVSASERSGLDLLRGAMVEFSQRAAVAEVPEEDPRFDARRSSISPP